MNANEALLILWFLVSVGCILLAWVKSHWLVAAGVAVIALGVGYAMGVIR